MNVVNNDNDLKLLINEPEKVNELHLNLSETSLNALKMLTHFTHLRKLKIFAPRFTEDIIKLIVPLKKLDTLEINCGRLMPEVFHWLTQLPELDSFKFFSRIRPTKADLEPLASISQLTSLSFLGCKNISEEHLFFISSMINLKTLDLSSCEITDTLVSKLKPLKHLQNLSLHSCKVTKNSLLNLSVCKHMLHLDLSGCGLIEGDDAVSFIKQMPRLETLNLSGCNKITNSSFKALAGLTNLISLNCNNCQMLEDLSFIKKSKQLQSLSLEGCNLINDKGIESIRGLLSLINLNLGYCEGVSDQGLKWIRHLTSLTELNLYGCKQITGEIIKDFENLHLLTHLNLGWCDLKDKNISYVASLSNLTHLNLDGSNLSNDGLSHLKKLSKLNYLSFSYCRGISRLQLDLISTFSSLESLKLAHCEQLSLEDLSVLKKLKTLKYLNLDDCFEISEEELGRVLPNVEIWI